MSPRSSPKRLGKLPTAFTLNKWFHFKYRVLGGRFWQWANGKLVHDNVQVGKEWKITAGTLGLGCHKSRLNCKTLFDNIKITLLVATSPKVTLGRIQYFIRTPSPLMGEKKLLLGEKKLPAVSPTTNHEPRMAFIGSLIFQRILAPVFQCFKTANLFVKMFRSC